MHSHLDTHVTTSRFDNVPTYTDYAHLPEKRMPVTPVSLTNFGDPNGPIQRPVASTSWMHADPFSVSSYNGLATAYDPRVCVGIDTRKYSHVPDHRATPVPDQVPVSSASAYVQMTNASAVHNPFTAPVAFREPTLPTAPHPTFAHVHVKLPKLMIKRFDGDLTKWTTFWDTFSSSIDANHSLSGIDKFSYLTSLLESTAAEAISGLTPTEANYGEAVATLKKRFGNPQLIINRHMDAMLNVTGVSSHHDVRGLRRLCDSIEAHIRGLRGLNVPAQSYGGILTSVLVNKLPPEFKLIVTREMTGETWDLERLMKTIEREVDARERAFNSTGQANDRKPRLSTASTLLTDQSGVSSNKFTCVYCDKEHASSFCNTVSNAAARKELLRKSGRCYICLRRHHLSRDCRSTYNCKRCSGRHHVSICTRTASKRDENASTNQESENTSQQGEIKVTPVTTSLVGSQTPILLQTARLSLVNLNNEKVVTSIRAIFDSGSQRTYVTNRVKKKLRLHTVTKETVQISTFGNSRVSTQMCDIVSPGIKTSNGEILEIMALTVPVICNPLASQTITSARDSHEHLIGLELADPADGGNKLDIDMLIGSDWYWSLVTGRVIRGESGPTAVHTKVGWILSGPAVNLASTNVALTSPIYTFNFDTYKVEPSLDDQLRRFWELESLGIPANETPVYEKFLQQIHFDGHRYEVSLPWKENHPSLPDNYKLCCKRLDNLLRKLRQTPHMLQEYDNIIRDQVEKGIVERVSLNDVATDKVHYLPHHGVVRKDKTTSKLRIVYDASARSTGPSLNNCLYAGPKFGQSIFDILGRFRLQRVALTGDIEKAFLMVSVQSKDRDSLRFLWPTDLNHDGFEPTPFRFTRVVFGVTSSPFLLNATINHHIETFRETDPQFVKKFLSAIYVDDLVSGANDVPSAYELCVKSRLRLASAGFKLRKFVTNSEELRCKIQNDDEALQNDPPKADDDQSFAKASLGVSNDTENMKILGVLWDVMQDQLVFDIRPVAETMESLEPTKRNLVRVTAKFFDPLGIVCPVTIPFKMLCQQLCVAKVGWDDSLGGEFLERWLQLLSMLKDAKPIRIPRCVHNQSAVPKIARLIGFCDASSKAYAAVVYLRLEYDYDVNVTFLAAKTRVAPTHGATIPRLELLSAVLLSKLITSIKDALSLELCLAHPVCFTDSMASLFGYKGFIKNGSNLLKIVLLPSGS